MELILLFAGIIISIFAQIKVHSAFAKGSKMPNSKAIDGHEVAQAILKAESLANVPVSEVPGKLADHYNPINRTLHLSPEVYGAKTISALAVAAHEVGHAIQHRDNYHYLVMRTTLYPVVGFASYAAPLIIIAGMFISSVPMLLEIGILLFAATVFFTVITLPVEFDASRRAMVAINKLGLVTTEESVQVKKVLDAAALTYVAAAIASILELVRLIMIARSQD